jgi:hypothetical protein
MMVSARQTAALRAQLAARPAGSGPATGPADWAADGAGYVALVEASFSVAVNRRFGRADTTADVIGYVADVRSRLDAACDEIDIRAAERLILRALGRGPGVELAAPTAFAAMYLLLAAMIADESLDDEGLDAFLVQARERAGRLPAGPAGVTAEAPGARA